MKVILSSKRRHHLARVIIFFLIVAGLIVCVTGCRTCFPRQYTLIISSTEGGSVTDPGEGTFTYNSGTVVDLVATPDAGYHFVEWTGDVSTIADVNAAATNITMNGSYNITANFALGTPVQDWYDLDAVRDNLGGSYVLMNDLDSTTPGYEELASPTANGGEGWQPIGSGGNESVGSFDGQGHEIRDLLINRPEENAPGVGLFGWVGEGGIIENVGVVNANVTGKWCVGALVGVVEWGTVRNSYSTGNVTNNFEGAGGLVGANAGIVSDSYSTGSVTGYSSVGGLVGANCGAAYGCPEGTLSNSYATGSVTGNSSVGGLVGGNGGPVTNCYSMGTVTGNSSVGGLVGDNIDGTVSNSFWDTETSGQATSDGGTGKTTAQMQDIATFSGAGWNITAVVNPGTRNLSYIWNIVDDETYPFLSWQP